MIFGKSRYPRQQLLGFIGFILKGINEVVKKTINDVSIITKIVKLVSDNVLVNPNSVN